MVWNVAFSVTDKDGRKLDAEAEVSPTESELEAKLRTNNLANLIYTGKCLKITFPCQNYTSSESLNIQFLINILFGLKKL